MSKNDNNTTVASPISFPYIPRLPEGSVVLGEALGHGGYGCVYQGTYNKGPVAVKQIINPNLSADAASKMVQNELKLLLRLRHSNFVCQVIGYQYADRFLSIVMTLAENGDLQKYLTTGRLANDWSTKARICLDVAKAVKSVHDENIFHGDLKAANVLLDRFLIPKLTDFGISKSFYSSISGSSSIRGTLRYVSPERFIHPEKKFSFEELVQTDTYGYGLILWETVTDGLTPYKDKNIDVIQIAKMKKTDPLQFIGELPIGVPATFGDLIRQYLEWEPSHRPPLTLALRMFDAYINTNPIMLPLLSSENSTTTISIPTARMISTSASKISYKDCELFTNDEISTLPETQRNLYNGGRYYFGINDYQKAIEYLNKLEHLDHPVAQRSLGLCYRAINELYETFLCFKKSAINDARGQYYLAWCFDHGYGTSSDKAGALILYSLSAAQGVAEAVSALCDMKWIRYKNVRQQLNESIDIMKLLRVSVITVNGSGQTLLHWVAEQGHIEVVRLLVTELGADVNVKDNDGRTPFHQAADNSHIEVIKLLVAEFGVDVNTKDKDSQTPLHQAAAKGHIEVMRMLVAELGAEVNVKDKDGRTPLLWAADNGYIEIVKLLVMELGADKDNDEQTLLHYATDNGLIDVIRLLVTELGQNADARDKDGWTLLHRAADKGQFGTVHLLAVDLRANINAKDNKGRTLLHLAAEKGDTKILRLLVIELGVNANTEGYRGRAPLHEAVDNERFETIKLLVSEFGADINIKDEDGRTPLHLATENWCIEAMKLLVKLGADTNFKDKDGRSGHAEIVMWLTQSMIDGLPKLQRWILYLCCLFTGPITDEVLLLVSHFLDRSADDSSSETIAAQLRILCERKLLKSTTENDRYSIHIALREAVRQHNTELCLRLRLTSGQYGDVFFIGAPMASQSGAVLQWQLRMIQASIDGGRARNFGVKYYNIVDIPSSYSLEKDFAPYLESVSGLVVFVRKATDPLRDDFPQFCKEKIIPIVEEKKLLFILCLKYISTESSRESNITEKNIALMQKAMETLMACLEKTHFMIRAEPPIDILPDSRNFASTENQKTYKDTVDVYMNGVFVGREKELLKLDKLLKDKEHRYITIYGVGGTGKTALALQAVRNFNSGKVLALSLVGVPKPSSLIKRIAGYFNIDDAEDLALQSKVLLKLEGEETILLYLDNVEDVKLVIETGDSKKKHDALGLMKFFQCVPLNVKILATSRVRLGWPNETILDLGGLRPSDGIRVFLQWVTNRKSEIDFDDAMKLSDIVRGHALSLRLLGGVFDSSTDSIQHIINDISKRLSKVQDLQSIERRHESINSCIQYSFDYLNDDLKLLFKQLNIFKTPFTSTLVKRALDYKRHELWQLKWLNHAPLESSVATSLHILRQHSWLDQRSYWDDPVLGEWRPNIIKMDTEFYSLQPRLRDFLNDQISSWSSRPSIPNDPEIQFYIALCYGVGFGVVNDLERQLEWCTKAAKNGHLEAQLTLADCYEHGAGGVSEDQKQAFDWYLMAAKAGDKGAQEEISKRYMSGNGVKLNHKDHDKWIEHCNNNKGSPLNIKFKFSLPLLHRAAEFGKEMLVRSLIEQSSAEVNIRDRYGRTPLYVAVEKGHMEMLIMLAVEFRADINIKDRNGRTPLHRAVEEGQIQLVRLLIAELGMDVNVRDNDGAAPLHWAAEKGQIQIVRLLVAELGADVNARNNAGAAPLHLAAENGQIQIVMLLVAELGADVVTDSQGNI